MTDNQSQWGVFKGTGKPHEKNDIKELLPEAPPWRRFSRSEENSVEKQRGENFQIFDKKVIELVNAALYLRRPLLVTGLPGSGKSSLAYAIAYELQLGKVLKWPITSRSTLKEALYRYDAVGRLQDQESIAEIGRYIQLGPLGTALSQSESRCPRVLLIDEIDKSDIDLPNDLLNVFEEGEFEIPELARIDYENNPKLEEVEVRTVDGKIATIKRGQVPCQEFPFVLMTSNGERDFPPAFKRRCLELSMETPNDAEALAKIITARFKNYQPFQNSNHSEENLLQEAEPYIKAFLNKRQQNKEVLANDQLLNVIFMITNLSQLSEAEKMDLIEPLINPIDQYPD